jgi:hypothetical protein
MLVVLLFKNQKICEKDNIILGTLYDTTREKEAGKVLPRVPSESQTCFNLRAKTHWEQNRKKRQKYSSSVVIFFGRLVCMIHI